MVDVVVVGLLLLLRHGGGLGYYTSRCCREGGCHQGGELGGSLEASHCFEVLIVHHDGCRRADVCGYAALGCSETMAVL